MSLLRSLIALFLVPVVEPSAPSAPSADPSAVAPPAATSAPPAVAVLCPARDAGVLGPAVAAGLARRSGARAVLVCTWGATARHPGLPPTRAARRLATALTARGHTAWASGRLVHLAAEDAGEAGRALAAAPGPTVLVVAGARDPGMDALVRTHDEVVVADTGEAAALAAVRLADQGAAVTTCPVPSGAARRLAALGLRARLAEQRGQATIVVVALLLAVAVAAVVLGAVAAGVGATGERQRAADLAALSGARAMHDAFDRLFELPESTRHLERDGYLRLARDAATATALRNGMHRAEVTFPDGDEMAPVRIRVTVRDPVHAGDEEVPVSVSAEAELAPPATATVNATVGAGEYAGPFEHRQGKPMRPDVACAFDRMEAAARADGVALTITSAWRSNAEQAEIFARRPDPRWVAPPGRSLHRLGTELDLGPPAAYGWLQRNAPRFGFRQRYSWEPWHWGFVLNPGTTSVGFGSADGARSRALQSFVPARFAPAISRAAQRWSVSAALLAAQLYAESGFNPFARSSAGAQGIAQFMPATAQAYGLEDPFDPDQAIDAQAHMMRDLLRQFGSVPLALAAYNAGPGAVARCGCIPPYPETRGYVARILGLLGGAGDIAVADAGLEIRLVR